MKNGKRQPDSFVDKCGRECNRCEAYQPWGNYHKKGKGHAAQCKTCYKEQTAMPFERTAKAQHQKLLNIQKTLTDKRCKRCSEWKFIDKFSFIKALKRYNNVCKACKCAEITDKRNTDPAYRELLKDRAKAYNTSSRGIQNRRAYAKKRRDTDELFRLKDNVRRRINGAMADLGTKKSKSTEAIIGCDFEYLKEHLHFTFEELYGLDRTMISEFIVHIDHIIPITTAETSEDVYNLNHWTNLQLLIDEDNFEKSDKLDWELEI